VFTTGKLMEGILARLNTSRHVMCLHSEHMKICFSKAGTFMVSSRTTSTKSILLVALQATLRRQLPARDSIKSAKRAAAAVRPPQLAASSVPPGSGTGPTGPIALVATVAGVGFPGHSVTATRKLLQERGETFRDRLVGGTVLGPQPLPEFPQPWPSGQDVTTF
jgi:hypothetical protein